MWKNEFAAADVLPRKTWVLGLGLKLDSNPKTPQLTATKPKAKPKAKPKNSKIFGF